MALRPVGKTTLARRGSDYVGAGARLPGSVALTGGAQLAAVINTINFRMCATGQRIGGVDVPEQRFWNIYINDLLNLIPSARANAVSKAFTPGEEASTTSRLILRRIKGWGRRCQVGLAPQKTKLLVVSRALSEIRLTFNRTTLTPDREMILGVTYDSGLTFRTHITQLSRTVAGKLASLRRIS